MYVDFWYEKIGIRLRNSIGIDNIMWESDYPHSTSTYPESRTFTERTLEGIPDDEKEKLLYQNAAGLYFL
jgi:predicted TIM-barrel fold metal-dependent hydrolase